MRAMEPSPETCPGCGQSVEWCSYECAEDCADAQTDRALEAASGALDREDDE